MTSGFCTSLSERRTGGLLEQEQARNCLSTVLSYRAPDSPPN